jgi:hypothetical protein
MWFNEKNQIIARFDDTAFLCSKCLALFNDHQEAKFHAANCHPSFINTHPLMSGLSVASITPESQPFERRKCERMAKISYMASGWDCPVLRRNKWISHGWYYNAFLLIDRKEIASYIVIGRVNTLEHDDFGLWHKDIVVDMFAVENKRRQGNMKLLLTHTLKSMRHTLETVWFQEPISEEGEKFLNKMSEETGLDYRTC